MKTLGDIVRSASQGFGKIVAGTAAVAYLALNSTACTGMPTQQPVQEPTATEQAEYHPSPTPQVEITPSAQPTPEAEPTSLVQPTSQILTPTPQISLAETLTDMIDSAWLYQSYSYQDIMNVYETIRTQNPKDEWFTVNIKPGASASLLANIISNYLGEDTDTRIIATAMLVQAQQNTDSEAEALYNAGNISTGKVVLPLNPTGGESNPYWEIGEQTNPPVLSAQVGETPTVEPTVSVVPSYTPIPQSSAEPTQQVATPAPAITPWPAPADPSQLKLYLPVRCEDVDKVISEPTEFAAGSTHIDVGFHLSPGVHIVAPIQYNTMIAKRETSGPFAAYNILGISFEFRGDYSQSVKLYVFNASFLIDMEGKSEKRFSNEEIPWGTSLAVVNEESVYEYFSKFELIYSIRPDINFAEQWADGYPHCFR